MQKIKEKLHIGKNKHHEEYGYENTTGYDNTYNTVGATGATGVTNGLGATSVNTSTTSGSSDFREDDIVERPVAAGVAEVPVVVTEQERLGHRHHEGLVEERRGMGLGEEVCGTKTFTEVEDRPVVKERVERILEHNPVEKKYVVETRFVGEAPIASATGASVIDTTERIVEVAEPGPRCPANAGQVMDGVIGGMGTGHMGTGHHHGLGDGRI
eukprot:GHUV01000602.1.p1 GENE.GHUV01000602.1~~GHUV01000602.1.p1  ORF type:complete len:213 (+),score=63.17 GHUV01000602.1:971-1609(+)